MWNVAAVILPFPVGTLCSAIHRDIESKTKVRGTGLTPAQLLAMGRRKTNDGHGL